MAFELRPVKVIYICDHVFITVVLRLAFLQRKFEMEFSGYGPYIYISIKASFFLCVCVLFPVSQSNLPLFLPLDHAPFFPLCPRPLFPFIFPFAFFLPLPIKLIMLSLKCFPCFLKKLVHLAHWGHLNFCSNIFLLTLLTVKTDISKTLCISCGT